MSYSIRFKPSAARELENLPEAARRRVGAKIDELRVTPRPEGARKLKSREGFLRLRVGDYRVIYLVQNRDRTVVILRVRHRREVYKSI